METLTPSTIPSAVYLFSTELNLMNVENLSKTLLKLFIMQPLALTALSNGLCIVDTYVVCIIQRY